MAKTYKNAEPNLTTGGEIIYAYPEFIKALILTALARTGSSTYFLPATTQSTETNTN